MTLGGFHEQTFQVLEEAIPALERDYPRLQGIAMPGGEPLGVGVLPRFAPDPYLVVTTLVETPDGRLLPHCNLYEWSRMTPVIMRCASC